MKFLILVCAALFAINTVETTAKKTKGVVVGYFNADAQDRPGIGSYGIENIPFNKFTHLIWAFIGLTPDTFEVQTTERGVNGGYEKFTSMKELHPNCKFMVSIGGWDDGGAKYSKMVSTSELRANFINSLIEFMDLYGFEGFDLDWEYPGAAERDGVPEDKQNVVSFLRELRQAFKDHNENWVITMAVPITKTRLELGYDVPAICELVDLVHLMTYDLHGNWDGKAYNHAVFQGRPTDPADFKNINVVDGLQLWEDEGCPAYKLVVGIPFYGRSYVLKSASSHDIGADLDQAAGGADPAPYTNARGLWAYYEICSKLQDEEGWTRVWDTYGKGPYAYKDNQWVGYDDPQSLKVKMHLIKQKGYGGAMTWSIDMDDFNGISGKKNPLLSIMHSSMKDYIVPKPKPATNPVSRV
ncbi:endochitinase [Bicyclus anynana]|uniref:Endochitinase n=1 Tax=Bicyclus anynana TaxID=110368 RepID=A0A6J1NSX6_BICAN|nr:endochitinase [Bicyclus anynana]